MKISNIKSSADFVKEIDKLAAGKGLTYFDAVMYYCEMNSIEIETAASLIKQSAVLKARIQLEAENLNMVKRGGRLPI